MVIKETTTDYELIKMFTDEHDAFAREAFTKFIKAHKSFIHNTCFKLLVDSQFSKDPRSDANDLYQIALCKIYYGAKNFKKPKTILKKEISYHIRGWLYKIILNAYKDEFIKKQKSRPELISVDSESQDKIEYDFLNLPSSKTALTRKQQEKHKSIILALEKIKLSDLQIDVLRIYMESGRFDDKGNFYLPPERMDELTTKHKVQKNTIIQCKKRLMEKIKKNLLIS